MKEIKDNSLNFKVEEIELEKIKGEIRKLEKKEQFLYKIQDISNRIFLSFFLFGGVAMIILFFVFIFSDLFLFFSSDWISLEMGIFWGILIIWGLIVVSSFIVSVLSFYLPNSIYKKKRNLKHSIERIKRELKSEITKKRVLDLIEEGGIKFNERHFSNALKVFERAQEILTTSPSLQNSKEIQNILYSKIKLAQENLNQNTIKKIEVLIKKSNEQKKQGKLRISLQEAQKALKIANEMFTSDRKKHREIKMIKTKFDEIYFLQINKLIEKGNQLKSQKTFNNSIETFKKALNISDNMYSSSQKDQLKEKIEQNLDLTYFDMINEKIESGNQLKRQLKFDDSINIYKTALKTAKNYFNPNKKNSEIKKIKSLITQSKIAKIKNTILNLGVKFDRLHIAEIVEKCSESEGDIIDAALEMIKNKEIYAEYFKSTQSVVFDKQANIDEIDKLMSTYKEWEEKGIEKK